jgi:hypothetical protein
MGWHTTTILTWVAYLGCQGCQLDVTAQVVGRTARAESVDSEDGFCFADASGSEPPRESDTDARLAGEQRVLQGHEVGGAVSEPLLARSQALLAHTVATLLGEQGFWAEQLDPTAPSSVPSSSTPSSPLPSPSPDQLTDLIAARRRLEDETAVPRGGRKRSKVRSANKAKSKTLLKERAQLTELIAAELRSLDDQQVRTSPLARRAQCRWLQAWLSFSL